MNNQADTTVTEIISKASPSVAVSGLTIAGFQVNELVLILTALYTLLQLYFLLRDKWWRQRKDYKG